VTIATDQGTIGVNGTTTTITVEMTRPSDGNAYIAGDVVSNSTSATTPLVLTNIARISGGSGYITGVRLITNKKSITPRFKVHFYTNNAPTVAADNAPFKEVYADISKRVGFVILPAMETAIDTTNSDMSRATAVISTSGANLPLPFTCVSQMLYAVLETMDGFTPDTGEKFTLVVTAEVN
jgi:hypothetical protein